MRFTINTALRLLLSATLLSSSSAFAQTEMTEPQFKQQVQKLFNESKNLTELISNLAISEHKKAAIVAWVKKNKIDVLPSFTLRGSDILLGVEEHNAKLTMTDFKRGKFHLNDKALELDPTRTVEQNLETLTVLIQNNKIAKFSFFPEANALLPLVLGAGALAAVAYGLWSMARPLDTDAIVDDIAYLLKKHKIDSLKLTCAEDFDGNGTYTDFQVEYEKQDAMGDEAHNSYTYLTRKDGLAPFDITRVKSDEDLTNKDSLQYKLLSLAHTCCLKPADCDKAMKLRIKSYVSYSSQRSGNNGKKSATKK